MKFNPSIKKIKAFVGSQDSGLLMKNGSSKDSSLFSLMQVSDQKSIQFAGDEIEDVITRQDSEGNDFLQLNFLCGKKILLTQNLIGFKPIEIPGMESSSLPKVVTTPDLLSIIEILEEQQPADVDYDDTKHLRQVYISILAGAKEAGFTIENEMYWLSQNYDLAGTA